MEAGGAIGSDIRKNAYVGAGHSRCQQFGLLIQDCPPRNGMAIISTGKAKVGDKTILDAVHRQPKPCWYPTTGSGLGSACRKRQGLRRKPLRIQQA